MNNTYKYFAFISYSSLDTLWGKRLHKRLEHYRMSSTLCSQHGWKRTPMRPVFFAPADIQPGGLSDELRSRLRASRHLIVICSPNSAQSEWVGEEIKYFHELGRTNNIHFFIVKGIPHSNNPATECIHPIINQLGIPEILGANIHERNYRLSWLNKERAYVQLISKLLAVEFDDIWQRHKRLLAQRISAWIIGSAVVVGSLFAVKNAYQPYDAVIKLKEITSHNEQLPPLQQIVVTLRTEDDTLHVTLTSFSQTALFKNLPHRSLNNKADISVTTLDERMQKAYFDLDTTLCLAKELELPMRRNTAIYGHVFFKISGASGREVDVSIEGRSLSCDSEGLYSIDIPIEQQRSLYGLHASVPLSSDTIFMPCFEGMALRVKDKR